MLQVPVPPLVYAAQLMPPKLGCCRIARLRDCMPPPHDTLQVPHSDHGPTKQSTAHGVVLHWRESASAGHVSCTPKAAFVTERRRTCVPEPQSRLQSPQLPQSDTSHAVGHG